LEKYVLVGGSALALHYYHRKNEGLDFFTFSDNFSKIEIYDYLKQFNCTEILNQTDDQIDLLIDGVKVTFFNAKWYFLRPDSIHSLNIASVQSIAAMKVNTLFLRAKYRDYYDLYTLVKRKMPLRDIFEYSKRIVTGLTFKLFATALIYIDDIDDDNIDHLDPIEQISKEYIRDFFQEKLAMQAIEK